MLKNLEHLNSNLLSLVIYSTNPTLDLIARDEIKRKYATDKEFIVDVHTMKDLTMAKVDSMASPLTGGKWVIHVNADKLSKKDLVKAINMNTAFGVTVFWTTKYAVYKYITGLEFVKKMSVYFGSYYLGRLNYSDVMWLYDKMLGKDSKYLTHELKVYVAENYGYDSMSICELFRLLKSGYEVSNKKDIIELVGVGGNSVDKLTMMLLTTSSTSDRGKKTLIKKVLKSLDDLSTSYEYKSIYSFMLNFLEGCLEMKQLQLLGLYSDNFKHEIPENFNEKRLARLKRYEKTILNEVSIPRILNLKLALARRNSYNRELDLVQGLIDYIALLNIDGVNQSKKNFNNKRR